MKKIWDLILTFLILSNSISMAQVPCERMPSKSVVSAHLKKAKPVPGMSPMYYSLQCNIDDSIKNRMLYLLDWRWTEDEINGYLNNIKKDYPSIFSVSKEASLISNGKNEVFIKVFDSLLKKKYPEVTQIFTSLYQVDNGVILTTAFSNFKEAIPLLQQAVSDSIHYHVPTVQLALARLGVEDMENKVIERAAYDSKITGRQWNDVFEKRGLPLIFLGTQKSLHKLTEWLDTSKMYASMSNGKINTKNSANVIFQLSNIIMNDDFQKIVSSINKFWGEDFEIVDDEMILCARAWMNKNNGKYKINKAYSPY